MNNKKKTRKNHPLRGKTLLDNLWVKQEIKIKIRKIFRRQKEQALLMNLTGV